MNESTSTVNNYREPFLLEKILKAINDLPEPPVMYSVNFNPSVVVGEFMPKNTIMFSSDLADKLIELGVLHRGVMANPGNQ